MFEHFPEKDRDRLNMSEVLKCFPQSGGQVGALYENLLNGAPKDSIVGGRDDLSKAWNKSCDQRVRNDLVVDERHTKIFQFH